MPAFGDSLTDAEIRATLAYVKSTWPERARAFQAEVTANAEAGR
jgi:mono/diheme cytochrome c family protein